MTTPAEPPRQQPEHPDPAATPPATPAAGPPADPPVDLGKDSGRPADLDPNDPYRFGLPDTPPPPEFAPPGWTPPGGWAPQPQPQPPSGQQPGQHSGPWHQQPGGYPPRSPGPYPGPPSFPPYPGGQQPPPYPHAADHAARQRARTGRQATTSLVLGIASILLFWTAFLDVVLVIAATAFGALAMSDRGDGESPESRQSSSKGRAVAGLVCAAVGAAAAVAWTVFLVHILNNCGGLNQPNSPALRACLQRQL